MASILKITDGTTTVDFLTDAAYRVTDWSPAVAARQAGELGGRGPYGEVVEEMTLFIGGASAVAKLATLRRLIDQAERWSRGEDVGVVTIRYKLTAGSEELLAVVHGPPSPGDEAIVLPARYSDAPTTAAIDPVTLRFKRGGLWLAPADTGSSSNVQNPTVATVTLTGTAYADSPYRLSLSSMPWNEEVVWNSLILAANADTAANAAKKLVIIEAETMAAGIGQPSSVSDTTNKARGNSVLRFNFSSSGTIDGVAEDVSAATHPDARRWAVYASVRNNGATAYTVRAYGASGGRYAVTGPKIIPANFNDNDPAWVHIGYLSLRQQLKTLFLSVKTTGTGTIDFDAVALLAVDDPVTSRAVAILADETAVTGTALGGARSIALYHALDYDTKPYVYFIKGSELLSQEYGGDPALFMHGEQPGLAFAWLACGRWNTAFWRATDDSNSLVSNVFGVERMKGYLTVV